MTAWYYSHDAQHAYYERTKEKHLRYASERWVRMSEEERREKKRQAAHRHYHDEQSEATLQRKSDRLLAYLFDVPVEEVRWEQPTRSIKHGN